MADRPLRGHQREAVMRNLNAASLILGLCCPAAGQSMEEWQRVPEAQLKFADDHRACTEISTPPTTGLQPFFVLQTLGQPVPKARSPEQKFTACMRDRGWVRK